MENNVLSFLIKSISITGGSVYDGNLFKNARRRFLFVDIIFFTMMRTQMTLGLVPNSCIVDSRDIMSLPLHLFDDRDMKSKHTLALRIEFLFTLYFLNFTYNTG